MKIIGKLKTIKNSAKKRIDRFIEKSALHFVFIIGIGITAIVSKIVFKKFLIKDYSFTSWKKRLTKINLNKMY
jgi:hypothetical protein